jgi:hypothetical protein
MTNTEKEKDMTTYSKDNRLTRLGRTPIPIEMWHNKHWSTLAYLEVCEVDCHGVVDWDRITVSERNWYGLYQARSTLAKGGFGKDGADYGLPVRTEPGKSLIYKDHCEVDAIMDMVDAGLVLIDLPEVSEDGGYYIRPDGNLYNRAGDPDPADGLDDSELLPYATFRLTREGREVVARLRAHKADGGSWAAFTLEGTIR